ncbi:DUF3530 family protein [Parathalassolituus penaei]|uniref:DUF3530 family protein n=1 Tax=Parathalassolituus penaei TaxID=2997323 RepID=A0A9X3EED8_9GAMM|nr:DUF3530 family protein [Parathalassolituus penaei]MCY0966063.1 DUF3530 family protein [Parathalassolituus penaei]
MNHDTSQERLQKRIQTRRLPSVLLALTAGLGLLVPPVAAEDPPAASTGTATDATAGQATEATAANTDGNNAGTANADSATTADTAAPPPAPPRVTPDTGKNRRTAVYQYLQGTLIAGERVKLVANDEPFGGLFVQESAGKPQGAALILHDRDQHLLWPEMIAPLQQQLPQYGWATLTIELTDAPLYQVPPASQYKPAGTQETPADGAPTANNGTTATAATTTDSAASPAAATSPASNDVQPPPPPQAAADTPPAPAGPDTGTPSTSSDTPGTTPDTGSTANNSQAPVGDTSTPVAAEPKPLTLQQRQAIWQAQTMARITAAMDYLETRGQLNRVVIASGHNSSWAIRYVQEHTELNEKGDAQAGLNLVLLQANNHPAAALPLISSLPEIVVPVLDVISSQYPPDLPEAEIEARAGAMRHQRHARYRQYKLVTVAGRIDNDELVRLVRGWLKTNAAGTELGRR